MFEHIRPCLIRLVFSAGTCQKCNIAVSHSFFCSFSLSFWKPLIMLLAVSHFFCHFFTQFLAVFHSLFNSYSLTFWQFLMQFMLVSYAVVHAFCRIVWWYTVFNILSMQYILLLKQLVHSDIKHILIFSQFVTGDKFVQ